VERVTWWRNHASVGHSEFVGVGWQHGVATCIEESHDRVDEFDGTVRYLTVREAALVQGFPNDYEFPGYRNRVMGVIGNAVAVSIARAIGATLRRHTGI